MFKMINFNKLLNKVVANKFGHFYYSTITRIVEYEYNGYVFNLSIENNETYIADGFVVHNCRSTTIPEVKKKYDIGSELDGERAAIGADGVEQVSDRITYGGWLKKQPKEFIDEALGPERSKLFRSGKLTIDKFVDPTGRVYTLDELEKMAGISML